MVKDQHHEKRDDCDKTHDDLYNNIKSNRSEIDVMRGGVKVFAWLGGIVGGLILIGGSSMLQSQYTMQTDIQVLKNDLKHMQKEFQYLKIRDRGNTFSSTTGE